MSRAVMLTAVIVAAVAVVMLMMIAAGIRIILESPLGQSLRCLVGRTLNSCVQPDAGHDAILTDHHGTNGNLTFLESLLRFL
ncbi:MAG: hypothetical protein II166_08000 [Firmicutes bacterium]|nr:hypothetical protein [Bacillota bacterium]